MTRREIFSNSEILELKDWLGKTGSYSLSHRSCEKLINSYEAQRECIRELVGALNRLDESTFTAAIEQGDKGLQMARIHGRTVVARAQELLK